MSHLFKHFLLRLIIESDPSKTFGQCTAPCISRGAPHTHTHTPTHACTNARTHARTHAQVRAHTHTHKYIHKHIHTYANTNTNTHTHTHTHKYHNVRNVQALNSNSSKWCATTAQKRAIRAMREVVASEPMNSTLCQPAPGLCRLSIGLPPRWGWRKATRAMRAMRENALEAVPFRLSGCTESFHKALSSQRFKQQEL